MKNLTFLLFLLLALFWPGTALPQDSSSKPAPISYDDHLVQANVLFTQGKLEEALAATEAAKKLDGKRFEAHATAALILHASGKTAEAKAAVDEALKLAPPDTAAKIQNIAKLVATPPETGSVRANSAAVSERPSPAPTPLSPTTRRQLDMLQLIIEEADKATQADERNKLLREFLAKSEAFMKENPSQLSVWTLRAIAALELGQAKSGWEAGQQMLKLNAENSEDAKVRKTIAMLDRKGWLTKKAPNLLASSTREQPFVNSLGMKFVPVPGTKLLFCIWETRKRDYAAYASANSGVDGSWRNPVVLSMPVSTADDHPVVNVNWYDAKAFCDWLTRKERADGRLPSEMRYRLPTNAEWSLAVGGATYPWGDAWPPPRGAGNYADRTLANRGQSLGYDELPVIAEFDDGFATTAPVGSSAANQFGLHDLGGNVSEWCEDRVARGSCWFSSIAESLVSSARVTGEGAESASRNEFCGFRVVLVGADTN